MSRPESVSSRIARRGSRIAIWSISLRFFSPPEKPSFTLRCISFSSISTSFIFSRASARNSIASSSGWPRCLRIAFSAAFRKYMFATPGISTGYWNARNMPSRARSSGASAVRSRPVEQHLALRDRHRRASGQHVRERALARAVRPHHRVHFARAHHQVDTAQDRGVAGAGVHVPRARAARPPCPSPPQPSSESPSRFCASTANSIGSSRSTSLQKPFTIIETASSSESPRWRQ